MNAKQRRRMSKRSKPIPGVETRTARARRYRRLLRRLFYSSLELLVLFLLAATILGLTFSDPPALPTGEEDRKTFVAVVQLRMVIALMQLCGMSMHVIRVVLTCVSVVSLLGAITTWWIFLRLGDPKRRTKDLHQADSDSSEG